MRNSRAVTIMLAVAISAAVCLFAAKRHPHCQNMFSQEVKPTSSGNTDTPLSPMPAKEGSNRDTKSEPSAESGFELNIVRLPQQQLRDINSFTAFEILPEEVNILRLNHTYLDDERLLLFDHVYKKDLVQSFINAKLKQLHLSEKYDELLAGVQSSQLGIVKQYEDTNDVEKKHQLLGMLYFAIVKSLVESIFPLWLGTPWDYNGTTQQPQQGEIACGYFVSTTLRDAGFKVERVKLAQQASMNIMKTVCDRETITVHKSVKKLIETVKTQGEGLYITGLSDHVGYILYWKGNVEFCHSFGKVLWEDAAISPKLNSSRFLSTGRIGWYATNKWLEGSLFKTVTSRGKPSSKDKFQNHDKQGKQL